MSVTTLVTLFACLVSLLGFLLGLWAFSEYLHVRRTLAAITDNLIKMSNSHLDRAATQAMHNKTALDRLGKLEAYRANHAKRLTNLEDHAAPEQSGGAAWPERSVGVRSHIVEDLERTDTLPVCAAHPEQSGGAAWPERSVGMRSHIIPSDYYASAVRHLANTLPIDFLIGSQEEHEQI